MAIKYGYGQRAILVDLVFCFLLSGRLETIASEPFAMEIISTIPFNISVGVALPWTGAALQLSVEHARVTFAADLNISLTLLYKKDDRTCGETDMNAPLLMTDYYYTSWASNRCIVNIAAGCGGTNVLPNLMKEWNVLLLSNSLAAETLFDPAIATTSITMADTFEGLSHAVLGLLRSLKWFHVTILTDSTAATEVYWQMAKTMKAGAMRMDAHFKDFNVDGYNFDSTSSLSMSQVLRISSKRSRVIFALAHSSVVIKLLRVASEEEIAGTGDFVFLVMQPLQQKLYGRASLFDHPSDAIPNYTYVISLFFRGVENKNGLCQKLPVMECHLKNQKTY